MEDMRNRKLANPTLIARTLHGYIDLVLRGSRPHGSFDNFPGESASRRLFQLHARSFHLAVVGDRKLRHLCRMPR